MEYAPIAKKAAYPRSSRPAYPTTMLRPIARITVTKIGIHDPSRLIPSHASKNG